MVNHRYRISCCLCQRFGHVHHRPILRSLAVLSPKRCTCTGRPDADSFATPKATSSRLASVHGRTGRRIWIMLAELVKRFPQHVFHIFQREPRTNLEGNTNLLTIQLKIPERYFMRYVLKAVSGWRGDHSRQLKPETSQTTQQPISCTPDTQGTSHLSASMVPRSRNTKFHCSPGLTFHPTFFFLGADQVFARVMASK